MPEFRVVAAPGTGSSLRERAQDLLARKRDGLGFIEGETPSLSAEQWGWLSLRMSCAGDTEATKRAGLRPEVVASWGEDPGFLSVYGLALTNRREAFKLLGSELLPNALRVIRGLLDRAEAEGDVRAAGLGLSMLLRSQGLLLDRVHGGEAHKVDELLGLLRTAQPVTVLDVEPRP